MNSMTLWQIKLDNSTKRAANKVSWESICNSVIIFALARTRSNRPYKSTAGDYSRQQHET